MGYSPWGGKELKMTQHACLLWMWELDCEEGWALKNWCFWTVVLEKTLKSHLDCKEIQPVHSEGDRPWDFFGRNDAKAEAPVLWPPHAKSWLIAKEPDAGRDWGQEEKGMTEEEMAGWYGLDGRESEWIPGDGDGQGGLACCSPWGRRVRYDLATAQQKHWIVHLFKRVNFIACELYLTKIAFSKTKPICVFFKLTSFSLSFCCSFSYRKLVFIFVMLHLLPPC